MRTLLAVLSMYLTQSEGGVNENDERTLRDA